jgi:hypothetical protein
MAGGGGGGFRPPPNGQKKEKKKKEKWVLDFWGWRDRLSHPRFSSSSFFFIDLFLINEQNDIVLG